VKQRCVLKQSIVNNDNLEVDARFFYIKQSEWGRERDSGETERERECVCERDSVSLKVKDSVGHKIDRSRKHLVMDMCD
jgi:hypothetical protein